MNEEHPVNPRVVISGLWITMLFIFAYVDLFAFFRADVIEDALAGRAEAFVVNQTFLAFTTLYVIPGSLMIFLTLVLPPRINRISNTVLATLYAATIAFSCLDETWIYYFIGSAIEVVLLAIIVWRSQKTL